MHLEQHVLYVQTRGFQAVDLEYEGGDVSMLVLPDQKDGLRDLEGELSLRFLHDCVRQCLRAE
jgi:serine protease inhibitor